MTDKPKSTSKSRLTKKQQIKRNISTGTDLIGQLNKQIEKHAKEAYGIEVHAQPRPQISKASSAELNIRRNDKTLQSLYNLIESEILPIALIGIQKAKEGDISMIKYWCDKYVPQELINKSWDKGEKSNSVTFLQQAIQVKMMVDASGKSLEEVLKATNSLVDTTSIEASEIINEES